MYRDSHKEQKSVKDKEYREKNKALLSEKKKLASQDPEFREKRKIYMRKYMEKYRKRKMQTNNN